MVGVRAVRRGSIAVLAVAVLVSVTVLAVLLGAADGSSVIDRTAPPT